MNDKRIGNQIKKARIDAKLSQQELGERLGVTWEMISRYENGRSSAVRYLDQIAEIFGKRVSYFLDLDRVIESESIEKIVERLKSELEVIGIRGENRVPIVQIISDSGKLNWESNEFYPVPSWVIEKYTQVYALRLSGVVGKGIEFGKNDIAILSKNIESTDAYTYILSQEENKLILKKSNLTGENNLVGILIYIERRYRY